MIMMALALEFALVAVELGMLLRDAPERAVASETKATTKSSLGSLIRGESPIEPWVERATSLPTPEVTKDEPTLDRSRGEPSPEPSRGEPKPAFEVAPNAEERSP